MLKFLIMDGKGNNWRPPQNRGNPGKNFKPQSKTKFILRSINLQAMHFSYKECQLCYDFG